MNRTKIKTIVLVCGLTSWELSAAGDNNYLCRATSSYEIDSSGKLVAEKGTWAGAIGSQGISFNIDRDSGEMIGTGLNTGDGWSVKVLNHGRRIAKETANYYAIITSALWPEYNYQAQHVRSIYVNEAFPGSEKPFLMHDGGIVITGLCK